MAMTAWARSKKKFCTGTQSRSHSRSIRASAKTMVNSEGVPPEPWKMSVKEGKAERAERGVPACGGTKVSVAKRNWTMVRTVGGSWRSMISMARTSRRGQEERMVVATVNMLGLAIGLFCIGRGAVWGAASKSKGLLPSICWW
jgi:hypothetical protein